MTTPHIISVSTSLETSAASSPPRSGHQSRLYYWFPTSAAVSHMSEQSVPLMNSDTDIDHHNLTTALVNVSALPKHWYTAKRDTQNLFLKVHTNIV